MLSVFISAFVLFQSPAPVVRGAPLQGLPKVSLQALLESPDAYEGKTVAVEAPVRNVCSRKGCWMELSASDRAPGIRVTFKDYGFFVPIDSKGWMAKLEGTIKTGTLSEGRAKHLESEGARITKGADGKPREIQLVAVGVELTKRSVQ